MICIICAVISLIIMPCICQPFVHQFCINRCDSTKNSRLASIEQAIFTLTLEAELVKA